VEVEVIDETAKSTHHAPVKTTIIFVLGLIYEIKVAA